MLRTLGAPGPYHALVHSFNIQYSDRNTPNDSLFFAADMFLKIQSDASFNSRPKSKSVAGGFHYLGRYDDPSFFNASIVNLCASIPVVCGAVSEAELAAAYANGHVAIEERNILALPPLLWTMIWQLH